MSTTPAELVVGWVGLGAQESPSAKCAMHAPCQDSRKPQSVHPPRRHRVWSAAQDLKRSIGVQRASDEGFG